jgi:hypothetical protein
MNVRPEKYVKNIINELFKNKYLSYFKCSICLVLVRFNLFSKKYFLREQSKCNSYWCGGLNVRNNKELS